MHDQSKSVLEYFYSLVTAFVIGAIGFHCIEYMLRPSGSMNNNLVSQNTISHHVADQPVCVDCNVINRQSEQDPGDK